MLARIEGWIEGRLPQKKVGILELGYARQIDWDTLSGGVDKKEVLARRLLLLEGSYSGAPGLYVSMVREAAELARKRGTKVIDIELSHDALVKMLKKSGLEVNMENQASIDAALVAYFSLKRDNI